MSVTDGRSAPIRYARSGDVSIAYQVTGDGPDRPRPRAGVLLAPRDRLGAPGKRPDLRAARVVRAADPLRQARDGALRPGRRAPRLRRAHGRRPRRDGRRRLRIGRAVRLLGGRAAERPLRGDVPEQGPGARPLRLLREAARPRRGLPVGPDTGGAPARRLGARSVLGRGLRPLHGRPERGRRADDLVPAARSRQPQPGGSARPHPHELDGRRARRAPERPVPDARGAPDGRP